jgi:glycosyltransferase involved in cell wall biosynthesis
MIKPYDPSLQKTYNVEEIMENLKRRFPIERESEEYKEVYTKSNPLVSIVIPTFNKGNILLNYSLKSILAQSYKTLEIIIVGDHCTDNTDELMSTVTDPRVIYTNLPTRADKGPTELARWNQGGCVPHNYGLEQVTGDFLATFDDDDYMVPDRIEKLVDFIREKKVDFVHHPFHLGTVNNIKGGNDSELPILGKLTTSAVFHHAWFKQIPGDIKCFEKYGEPGDWNKFRKIFELGATVERFPQYVTIKDFGDREKGTFKG